MNCNSHHILWGTLLLFLFNTISTLAQPQADSKKMLRVFVDNDFFAFRSEDGGYSNGMRLDLFEKKDPGEQFFADEIMLKAGSDAINTTSWSVMQVMITSNDIENDEWLEGDYPYSGSLFITRALNSVNPVKEYAVKTEWVIGMMGPKTYAGELQTWFHEQIGRGRPMGWRYQMPASVLANVNVSAEKLLYSSSENLEVIGGGEVNAGTMHNAVTLRSIIRFGKMSPYFTGFINRYISPRDFQVYYFIRPQFSVVFHNTLLEGSMFRDDYSPAESAGAKMISESEANTLVPEIDYGLVMAYGPASLSFTLNINSGLVRGQGPKLLGNVSLYVGL